MIGSLQFVILVLLVHQSSQNILIPCISDSDCAEIVQESTCSAVLGSYCTCPAGHTFSTDVTKCLKESLYGEACAEAVQCAHMLTGAQCNGVCECADGLTYVRGRCRKLVNLNESCRDEIDCFFGFNRESVECRDGKCQCADGFYQRFTNVCRRESINGEACIVNQDCSEPDSLCQRNNCTASVGTQTISMANAAVQTTHSLEIESLENPVQIEKSSSFSNRRLRNYFKYHKLENSDAAKFSSPDDDSTQFGESCEDEHSPCPGLKYSQCRRGFCHCQDGFYEKDGICKAELGELVEDNSLCGHNGTFTSNRCGCRNDEFTLPHMRSCIKSAIGINTSCTQPSQCTPYGAAYCIPVSPGRVCTCYDYAKYNEATELCEMKQGMGEYCGPTDPCKITNTVCTSRNTCECKPNFIAQNDECKPGYSAECEKTEDCAFENAECKFEMVNETESNSKQCKCNEDFIGIGNACYEKADYNDTCTENDQCKPLLGDKASCIDNKCNCDDTLHFKNGQCNIKKGLGESCSKSAECLVENDAENDPAVECRNGVCQCKHNFAADTNQNRCIRPRPNKSSESTSPLKVVTLMLIASAVVITGSALKDAYYP